MNTNKPKHTWDNKHSIEGETSAHTLEAQLDYGLEAHKCGLGTLIKEALVTVGSGPNCTPPFKLRKQDYGDKKKNNSKTPAGSYDFWGIWNID